MTVLDEVAVTVVVGETVAVNCRVRVGDAVRECVGVWVVSGTNLLTPKFELPSRFGVRVAVAGASVSVADGEGVNEGVTDEVTLANGVTV